MATTTTTSLSTSVGDNKSAPVAAGTASSAATATTTAASSSQGAVAASAAAPATAPLLPDAMNASMSSSFASVTADGAFEVEFKPMVKNAFFIHDTIWILFQLPDDNPCPSYLDVVRILPLSDSVPESHSNEASAAASAATGGTGHKEKSVLKKIEKEEYKSSMLKRELLLSYCHWKVESSAGLFSITAKVDDLVKINPLLSAEGCLYVAQYVSAIRDNSTLAESEPFRVYPILEESVIELPSVFSDDGLIVLDSSSDTDEPELVEENELGDEPSAAIGSKTPSEAGSEDVAIVMSAMELRKMQEEQQTSHDSLRSFIKKCKRDIVRLTRSNETLKQKVTVEREKVTALVSNRKYLTDEIAELKAVMSHQQTLFQNALTERERQLREEQHKTSEFKNERSEFTLYLKNLRCCVDAHLEARNFFVKEVERLQKDNEEMAKEIRRLKVERIDKYTETSALPEPKVEVQSNQSKELEDRVQDLIERLQTAKLEYISLYKENKRKEKALENICNWASLAKDGMSLEAPTPTQVPSLVSLSRSKCSSSVDEFPSASVNKGSSSVAAVLPQPSSSNGAGSSFASFRHKESKNGQESLEDDLIELGSDSSRLSLPPRQKRKIELVRRTSSAAAATAGASSGAAVRAVRGKMVVRGRHRASESLRTVKRDISVLEQDNINPATARSGSGSLGSNSTRLITLKNTCGQQQQQQEQQQQQQHELPQQQQEKPQQQQQEKPQQQQQEKPQQQQQQEKPQQQQQKEKPQQQQTQPQQKAATVLQLPLTPPSTGNSPNGLCGATAAPAAAPRWKACSKKKEPLAPSSTRPSAPVQSDSSTSGLPTSRGSNTYSAAGLISDLETDASNTEEEASASNPHICPLCMSAIHDYEAHMREVHKKQPCPICGYVFDTSIPLYVMTYHVERHLEEANADGPSSAPQ